MFSSRPADLCRPVSLLPCVGLFPYIESVGGSTLALTVSVFLLGTAKPAEAIAIFPLY